MRVNLKNLPQGTRIRILEVITDRDKNDDVFIGKEGVVITEQNSFWGLVRFNEPPLYKNCTYENSFHFDELEIENLSDPDNNY